MYLCHGEVSRGDLASISCRVKGLSRKISQGMQAKLVGKDTWEGVDELYGST